MTKTYLVPLVLTLALPCTASAVAPEMIPTDELELTMGRTIDPTQGIMFADDVQAPWGVTYNLPAQAGHTYVIATHLATLPDSVLELRGDDNTTLLASDDDGGAGLASQITWTAATTETLHVTVRGYSPSQAGRFALAVSGLYSAPCDAVWPCELEESIPLGGSRGYAFFAHDNSMNLVDATFGLETSLGTLPDSTLALYDADGTTLLAYNDDAVSGELHSALKHTVPRGSAQPRLRFVEVAAYSPQQSGSFLLTLGSNDTPADFACIDACDHVKGIVDWLDCIVESCQ